MSAPHRILTTSPIRCRVAKRQKTSFFIHFAYVEKSVIFQNNSKNKKVTNMRFDGIFEELLISSGRFYKSEPLLPGKN